MREFNDFELNVVKQYCDKNNIELKKDIDLDEQFIKLLYNCITCELPNEEVNDKEFKDTIYARGFVDGKVKMSLPSYEDARNCLIVALVSSKGNVKAFFERLAINAIIGIIGKIRFLKNNETRCLYLRIIILSDNNPKNSLTLSQVLDFNTDIDGSKFCPFSEYFKCKRINQESMLQCGFYDEYPFVDSLDELDELGFIIFDRANDILSIV